MPELREIIHYGMHFGLPFAIASIFFRKQFYKASILMLLANIIDLDHLLSNPVFDPNRCSIGFHMLHSYFAIAVYIILLFMPRLRTIAIGLGLHILTDLIDCLWMV